MLPIIDLHCDLLEYLAQGTQRSPYDLDLPCNLLAMNEGKVRLQILAVFTKTEAKSTQCAQDQLAAYAQLALAKWKGTAIQDIEQLQALWAIENVSGFFEENEPFQKGVDRLLSGIQKFGAPAYASMTWNEANRFGGGNASKKGLTQDGQDLLNILAEQGIALDLSHTSDALAYEALNYIDKEGLSMRVLASHSNLRSVCPMARNLPDELITEIARRKGVIGLNFFQSFVGKHWSYLCGHVEKLLDLGASRALCFGADFFHTSSVPEERLLQYPGGQPFFEEMASSSAYPKVLALLKKELGLSEETLRSLAYENAESFLLSR